jgi:chemotaxis signal transduction protein
MKNELQEQSACSVERLAGKYLAFNLRREFYGIPVLKVWAIMRSTSITAVPQMPVRRRN